MVIVAVIMMFMMVKIVTMVIVVVMTAHSPDSEPHQLVLDPSGNHRRLLSPADPDPPSPETPAPGFSPAPATPPSGAGENRRRTAPYTHFTAMSFNISTCA